MRILHTSDWHLDAKLNQNSRAEEHRLFFGWLRQILISESVDALIVSGDIFDSGTPGNAASLRYTQFLRDVWQDASTGKSPCRNVIVTAGNHDSPSFLNATGPLLEVLGIHVVAQPSEHLRDMIIPLSDASGRTRCLVAAVPFLRERDLAAFVEPDENFSLAERTLRAFRAFYRQITDEALAMREEILKKEASETGNPSDCASDCASGRIPILATGHLFTAHGQTLDDDGVRPVHVGTLDQFPACDFPSELDYIALGHLHVPQIVDGQPRIQYSGSPIPMGFSEITVPKRVLLLETPAPENMVVSEAISQNEESTIQTLQPSGLTVRTLTVPRFQSMKVLRGDFAAIRESALAIPPEKTPVWVKAEFTGDVYELGIRDQIEELFQSLPHLQLLNFENRSARSSEMGEAFSPHEDLKQMDESEVFDRFLNTIYQNLGDDEKSELRETFQQLLLQFHEQKVCD